MFICKNSFLYAVHLESILLSTALKHIVCVCVGGGGTYTIIIILKEKYFHLIISANCHLLLE